MKRVGDNPPARFPDRPPREASDPWWIAKLRPRQEKAMAFDLIRENIEYYLPMYTKVVRRRDTNKPRKSVLPLFPGYISFCAARGQQSQIFKTGRVVDLIEIRHQRRFIEELNQIYLSLSKGMHLQPLEHFSKGTPVVVRHGPLKGVRGVITKVHNSDRLVLNVEGLGRALMTIDAGLVARAGEERDKEE